MAHIITPEGAGIALLNYFSGFGLTSDAIAPNTKIDVVQGMCADSANAVMISYAGGKIDFTTVGPGGLDTGSIGAGAIYNLFAVQGGIGGAAISSVIASLSAAPSFANAAGYSTYRLIGTASTDGSSHLIASSITPAVIQVGTSLSALSSTLDFAFGNSEGSILQRGSSAWHVLPPGTAGMGLQSGGSSALNKWASPPYFSAYLNANQSVSSGVWTKIQFNAVDVDSNSWWDSVNYRWVPKLAGRYSVRVQAGFLGSTIGTVGASIYKNGAIYAAQTSYPNSSGAGGALAAGVSKIVQVNGSTDYLEGWGFDAVGSGAEFTGQTSPIETWFEAEYIGP